MVSYQTLVIIVGKKSHKRSQVSVRNISLPYVENKTHADDGTRTHNPSVMNRVLQPLS